LLSWYDRLPKEFQDQAPYFGGGGASNIGVPGGGSDNASFACYGAPTFGLGAAQWDYSNFTWHTDKDTYDKVVFDDLKRNATLTAMLVYLASEDPMFVRRDTTIAVVTRPRPAGLAAVGGGGGRGGRGGRGADPNAVTGTVVRSGDSLTVVFTLPTNPDTAGRGGGGRGAGGGRGGGGGRGAGGRGQQNAAPRTIADCPKAARVTNPRIR
jgi:hypothetical protein